MSSPPTPPAGGFGGLLSVTKSKVSTKREKSRPYHQLGNEEELWKFTQNVERTYKNPVEL